MCVCGRDMSNTRVSQNVDLNCTRKGTAPYGLLQELDDPPARIEIPSKGGHTGKATGITEVHGTVAPQS